MRDNLDFPTYNPSRNLNQDNDDWKIINSNILYDGDHVQLKKIKTLTPTRSSDKNAVEWILAHRKNAVVIAPQLENGNYIMIKQERIPIKKTVWEFVAGQIDDEKNKTDKQVIIDTALRELQEEAGYELCKKNGKLIPLGYYFSSQGFTDEHAYLFIAKNVVKSKLGVSPDLGEAIVEIKEFTYDQIQEMIINNKICDANTLSIFSKISILKNKQ